MILNSRFSNINIYIKNWKSLINNWNYKKHHCPGQNMIPHNKIEFIYIITLLVAPVKKMKNVVNTYALFLFIKDAKTH